MFAPRTFAAVATALAAWLPASASARYALTPVTFPSFVTAGPIGGVDRLGQMAGVAYETGNQYPDCVYFDGATLIDLTAFQGNFCHFNSMTAQGLAVGQLFDFSGYINYAVSYSRGRLAEINLVVNSFLGVNNNGVAISNLPVDGFAVYDIGAGKVDFDLNDPRENCAMAFPYAINDNDVVLGYDQCRNGSVRYETVANGVFTYFQAPPGFTVATDGAGPVFNNRSQIVVRKPGSGHAFLWATAGPVPPRDLGTLAEDPNGTYTTTGLNDTTAVGTTSGGYAWIWTMHDGMRNLSKLVPPSPYAGLQPQTIDARGDIGCAVASNPRLWLYFKNLD